MCVQLITEEWMNAEELIQSLIDDLNELPHRDEEKLDYFRSRAKMVIREIFGNSDAAKQYIDDISKIEFNAYPSYKLVPSYHHGLVPTQIIETKKRELNLPTEQEKDTAWNSGKVKMLNTLKIMLDESKLEDNKMREDPQQNQVFVVHGHDEGMKESVARALGKLGLEPIILHEQPNRGRTIIEKFEDFSVINFAIVLLSPDDMGCSKSDYPGAANPRARQNVIFELGYFIGKLGRNRVAAILRGEDTEKPSDIDGIAYISYDSSEWKSSLAMELKACGYDIDMNKLYV